MPRLQMSFSLCKDISLSETAAVGVSYTFSIFGKKKTELRIFYILCLALCWLCWSLVVWGVITESRRVSVNTHTHTHRARDVVSTAEMALYFRERCKQHFSEQPRTALIRATLTSDNMAKPEGKTTYIFYILYVYAFGRHFIQSVLHCIEDMHFINSCIPWESKPMTLVLLASWYTVYLH